MNSKKSTAILLCTFLFSAAIGRAEDEWPRIEAVDISFDILFDADRIDIEVPIQEEGGDVLYNFVCRGGDFDNYLAPLMSIEGARYMPPLTCVLYQGRAYDGGSLLIEDGTRASYSRGYVSHQSLLGSCAKYPQFGTIRTFQLRGLEISLEFTDVRSSINKQTGESRLSFAKLRFSVKPEKTAKTAIAEQSGYLSPNRPGGSCSEAVKGYVPLLCRDADTLELHECLVGGENER